MCLLLHQPKGLTLSKWDIKDYVSHNPHGFGAARGDGKKLHWMRLVGDAADVDAVYRRTFAGRECILHFRLATHGAKDETNAHPFPVVPGLVVAHNGILDCGNALTPEFSDTWHLVEHLLRPLALAPGGVEHLMSDAFCHVLGKMIGASNKLAFIHASGRVALVNGDAGVTHRGAWYSNTYAWTNNLQPLSSGYGTYRGKYASGKRWSGDWDDYTEYGGVYRRTGSVAADATKGAGLATMSDAEVEAEYDRLAAADAAASVEVGPYKRAGEKGRTQTDDTCEWLWSVVCYVPEQERFAVIFAACKRYPVAITDLLCGWYDVDRKEVTEAIAASITDPGNVRGLWIAETLLEIVDQAHGLDADDADDADADATGDESGGSTLALMLPSGQAVQHG